MKVSQLIYTGTPHSSCNNIANPLVTFNALSELKAFRKSHNCILFREGPVTVRVTVNGIIKVHLKKDYLARHLGIRPENYISLFSTIISQISPALKPSCVNKYTFSCNNINFCGKTDFKDRELMNFVLRTFNSYRVTFGVKEDLDEISEYDLQSYCYEESHFCVIFIRAKNIFIKIFSTGKYTGICSTFESFNAIADILS